MALASQLRFFSCEFELVLQESEYGPFERGWLMDPRDKDMCLIQRCFHFSCYFDVFAFFAVEHQNCAIGEGLKRNQVKPTQKDQIIPWVHDGVHVECIPKLKRLNDVWISGICASCTKSQFLLGKPWSKLSTPQNLKIEKATSSLFKKATLS